jgi:ankyrin repeat protein
MACQQGHPAVVSALIAAGLQVDARSFEGATPLFYAAQAGHPNVAAILLASGADPEAELPTGATPLLIACQMAATQPSH